MQENEVTPSNVMEIKTDSPNKSKWRHASPCNDLLQNNSLQFSNASYVRIDIKDSVISVLVVTHH